MVDNMIFYEAEVLVYFEQDLIKIHPGIFNLS